MANGMIINRRIAVFRAGRSRTPRSVLRPGFPRIVMKTYFARSTLPCQTSEAARPEIVTIAKINPAFRASVKATLLMNAGSVGEEAWRNRGRRSLATGPVAAETRENPAG